MRDTKQKQKKTGAHGSGNLKNETGRMVRRCNYLEKHKQMLLIR